MNVAVLFWGRNDVLNQNHGHLGCLNLSQDFFNAMVSSKVDPQLLAQLVKDFL